MDFLASGISRRLNNHFAKGGIAPSRPEGQILVVLRFVIIAAVAFLPVLRGRTLG
jgi:hypothetical protein